MQAPGSARNCSVARSSNLLACYQPSPLRLPLQEIFFCPGPRTANISFTPPRLLTIGQPNPISGAPPHPHECLTPQPPCRAHVSCDYRPTLDTAHVFPAKGDDAQGICISTRNSLSLSLSFICWLLLVSHFSAFCFETALPSSQLSLQARGPMVLSSHPTREHALL